MINNHWYSERAKLMLLQEWSEHAYSSRAIPALCDKYQCSPRSCYIWLANYRAGKPLLNKRPIPHYHPTTLTSREQEIIRHIREHNSHWGTMEVYTACIDTYHMDRHYQTIVKYLSRLSMPQLPPKFINAKPYNNPNMFGVKMQIDVKFVPTINYRGQLAKDHKHSKYKLYQYTIIDMATNKVYRYAYDKHDANSTMDFIVRAIQFYGYIPKIIQTDNGREFTNKYLAKVGDDTQHPMDILCNSLGIQHKLIPPGRPQHNGKVERVHGTDQRRFYNYTSFDSLTDLNTKLATYNTYHNTIRTRVLRDRYGNMERYSPNQKEAELLSMLVEQAQEPTNKVQIRVALQLGTTAKHTYIDKLITLHTPRFCTQSELAKLLSTNNTT